MPQTRSTASASKGKRKGLPKQPSQRKIEAKKSGAASGGTVRTKPSVLDKKREARKTLVKSSGTTRGEVKGVVKALRSGAMSKGGAIKAMKGGPSAGVEASKGNTKKVKKAIRTLRKKTTYRAK